MFDPVPARAAGNAITRPRRLLVIGDPAPELAPFEQEFTRDGFAFAAEHAHTPAEIRDALARGPWDAILSSEETLRLKEQLAQESAYLLEEIESEHNFRQLAGSSAVFLRALSLMKAAAASTEPVLICGETGTGKELFARALHGLSPRHNRVLVKVDCTASLPDADLAQRMELASEGTLFLDEVGALPLQAQASVVQAIHENRTRVVAVTNRDLAKQVEASQFRGDLCLLLSTTRIRIPPLRERRQDIPALISFLLCRFSRRTGKQVDGVSPDAFTDLLTYSWPGNVRELEYVLERAVVLADSRTIGVGLLGLSGAPDSERLADVERRHIVRVLDCTSWVIEGPRGAAAKLSLHPSTLRGRMKKLGIGRQTRLRQ